MFCSGHMALSCFLLSKKCHYGVFNKSEVYSTSSTTTMMPFNDDALHKVRLLVYIVKVALSSFIRFGSELALEKSYVASCSMYGCDVMLFNPMNNCGRFHFCFYLLFCTMTYTCVRMKVAINNNSDSPYPHKSMGTIYNTLLLSKLNKPVMEMYRPLFGSKRIVNMDNLYTHPTVSILLLNHKVSARGDV
jgi:hypothetical protein